MAEPSLSEITNINADASLGGGELRPLIDNSKLVDNLNQSARYHAENTWRKYSQFLQNKQELFKNISDIQGLETAQQDRDLLKGQAADILGDILKDPSVVTGGHGYSELQGKIAKFKSDAMTSKQDKVDDEANARFMAANPELMSEDNRAMRENFWKAPLGARKPVLLKMPTIFDEKTAVEGLIKGATTESKQIVGKDGKPGEGYIANIVEIDPEKVKTGWNMIVKGGQQDKNAHDLVESVRERYGKLPERERAKYDAEGGIEKFWADRGDQYLKAYFPDGKFRYIKDIDADPNYLGQKRIDQDEKELKERAANDRANRAIEWEKIGLRREELKKASAGAESSAMSVLNEAAGVLKDAERVPAYNPATKKNGFELKISDPTLLQKFANVDKDGKTTNVADYTLFDETTEQPVLVYLRRDKFGKPIPGSHDREIPIDKRLWLKTIAANTAKGDNLDETNVLIDKALTANGGKLIDLINKLKGTPAAQPAAPKLTQAQIDFKKKYNLK